MTIQIHINGEPRALDAPTSVRGLLEALGVDTRHVAVERNRALVPKRSFDDVQLEDGDQLEIVTLVGGG